MELNTWVANDTIIYMTKGFVDKTLFSKAVEKECLERFGRKAFEDEDIEHAWHKAVPVNTEEFLTAYCIVDKPVRGAFKATTVVTC